MKLKIIAPEGVVFGGKNLPKGTEIDIAKGPHSDAWLRFKQAEIVKEGKAKPGPSERLTEAGDLTPAVEGAADPAAQEGAGEGDQPDDAGKKKKKK